VDGLGRLTDAAETLTKTDSSTVAHSLDYQYDMLSQLTDANITDISGFDWICYIYSYDKAGNVQNLEVKYAGAGSDSTDYGYDDTDLMKSAVGTDSFTLDWDNNGNMENLTSDQDDSLTWNWDNKLRSAEKGAVAVDFKYDPAGNRIFKNSSTNGDRKFIVDVVGKLPVVLMEIDDQDVIQNTYINANSQIIAQHNGSHEAEIPLSPEYSPDKLVRQRHERT